MEFKGDEIETLRLLRAFMKITDQAKRREIIELAETLAQKAKPEEPKF